jgi:hypothetical protein
MKLILKCSSHEFSADDIEWALVSLDALLLERALARRRLFLQSQTQDDQLYEMYWWDNTPDFFSLSPDLDSDHPLEEDESLEDTLRDHAGQPIAWTSADFHRISDETAIPDAHLRAVECTRMWVDEDGIAWGCYPKYMDHMDADVRTSTIPWELLEGQRLFTPQP